MKDVPGKFLKMSDFISLKKDCIFCQTPLRVNLSNYIGVKMNGLPAISAPLEDGLFKLNFKHTTPEFSIKADITMQPSTNIVIFDNFTNGDLPNVDAYLVKKSFEEYSPLVELYCASKSCKSKYHILSEPLTMIKVAKVTKAYQVLPFKLFLEGFRVKNLVVSNIQTDGKTSIHSLRNEDADPLRVDKIDFESMSKEKLFTRIQTLVTFS